MSLGEVMHAIARRDSVDDNRYYQQYPGWKWDMGDYISSGLIIFTDNLSEVNVEERVVKGHAEWKQKMANAGKILRADSQSV